MSRKGAIQQDKQPEKNFPWDVPWTTRTVTDVNKQGGASREIRGLRVLSPRMVLVIINH